MLDGEKNEAYNYLSMQTKHSSLHSRNPHLRLNSRREFLADVGRVMASAVMATAACHNEARQLLGLA
ncbi:MAG TPA: hypothetical protein DEA68_06270 [Verrucomicrobiales bacterium]|nr:hypothetical protein [Verrucomicrobiales bacterium]